MKQTAPAKNLSMRLLPPASVGALGMALCATFTMGSAQASVVFWDIPDVTLGNKDLMLYGTTLYSFQRQELPVDDGIFFTNFVDTLGNSVVGRPVLFPPIFPGETIPDELSIKNFATALGAGAMIDGNRTDYVSNISIPGGEGNIEIPVILSKGATGSKPFALGDFYDNGTAFIGLRFELPAIGNGFYYGCVEAVGVADKVTLTTFAYENQTGVGILAGACASPPGTGVPEPGTLALLIAGAAGVLALRRRQRAS